MKKIDKTCFECKNNIGKLTTIFNVYLCPDCKLNNKYILVSNTNTKKLYPLNDSDLENLTPILKKSSYNIGIFYTKDNIFNYLCKKYNIEKYIEKIPCKKINRKKILINALSKYKLILRSDSKLCKKYIEGSDEYSIDNIVERMCQMKYLYDYCHMNECLDEAYEEHVEELNDGYFPDIRVSERAEIIALNKYSNDKFPEIFPWMIEEN